MQQLFQSKLFEDRKANTFSTNCRIASSASGNDADKGNFGAFFRFVVRGSLPEVKEKVCGCDECVSRSFGNRNMLQ